MTDKCGTLAGYSGHRYRKEATCDACRAAKREYQKAKLAQAPRCTIPECPHPIVSGELCGVHRDREKRNGDPLIYARDPERNFWGRVKVGPVPDYAPHLGKCWIWTGKVTKNGYGTFRVSQQYVHRYSYEHMVAEIPPGLTIDHLCRVTRCVTPYHLEPVTLAENSRRGAEARKAIAS